MSEPANSLEHRYFQAIEQVFTEYRGGLLSPKDWQIARRWYGAEIPLELVLTTIQVVFESRPNAERIWSLGYFNREVTSAWRTQQQLQAAAAPVVAREVDVAGRLHNLAASLPEALADVAARIRALEGDAETVEGRLAELDREVFSTVAESLSLADLEAIDRELAESRSALADRLPAEELDRAMVALRERMVREVVGLPMLSLFSLEACGVVG